MAYIAPIHRPSSVRHALKLSFLDAEEECLVVAYVRSNASLMDSYR
jgi:DNA damage-binding protein 1